MAIKNKKIINDPVYGLISINSELVFTLIQHPFFQRLRNIHQLGMSHLVYPGATHTRFQHCIGAMHLMQNAMDTLIEKGVDITPEEQEATLAAILLHDIGHTPFSHALENFFVPQASHEEFTHLIIKHLNEESGHALDLTIQIINNQYHKHFLHQLVSSQLDVDRLDYLNRDSFYTGVSEGVIGAERIIKMLNVKNDQLVAEAKAVYSIEKFIISRRLMYWQVYLHKTVHVAEQMLIKTLERAQWLYQHHLPVFTTPSLAFFFETEHKFEEFEQEDNLQKYIMMDDINIWFCIQQWQYNPDTILAELSSRLCNRRLFHIDMHEQPYSAEYIAHKKDLTARHLHISVDMTDYFVISGEMENRAYNAKVESIWIMDKQEALHPLEELSDHLNHRTLSQVVSKYYVCYPKEILP